MLQIVPGGVSPWVFHAGLSTDIPLVAPGPIVSIVGDNTSPANNRGNPSGTVVHSLRFQDGFVGTDPHHFFAGFATQDFFVFGNEAGNYLFQFSTSGSVPTQLNVALLDLGTSQDLVSGLTNGTAVSGWTPHYAVVSLDADLSLRFSLDTQRVPFSFFIDDVGFTRCDPNAASCIPGGPTNNTPEPGTLLLVGAALAAGAAVRRKAKA